MEIPIMGLHKTLDFSVANKSVDHKNLEQVDLLPCMPICLTHCSLVQLYDDVHLSQNWLR